jgi:acyl-CoA synthetase (AMP-forming)/AMP-acid ligase II
MGLIGSYLGVIQCGGSGVYMSPISFVKNPVMWIEAISTYRGTHIQSPNFGYKLSARKFVEKYGSGDGYTGPPLDLSSLRHMFNAAEPISCSAIALFLRTFSRFGLNPAAMKPGYGLAEHTVYVSDGGGVVRFFNKLELETHQVAVDVCEPMPIVDLLTEDSGMPVVLCWT